MSNGGTFYREVVFKKIVNSSDRNCMRGLSDIPGSKLKISWKGVL